MLLVARDCVGKILVHRSVDGVVAGRIVETEAYRGPKDRAAHSYGGRRTPRTEAMFGRAGHAYMFVLYGLHDHFNIVAAQPGEPHAVLIRAVEPLYNIELMCERRGRAPGPSLTNGPGKLCQAFGLSKADYGRDLVSRSLYLADGPRGALMRSRRIGIDYAGIWAEKPWRYHEQNNPYVSVARRSSLC